MVNTFTYFCVSKVSYINKDHVMFYVHQYLQMVGKKWIEWVDFFSDRWNRVEYYGKVNSFRW